MQSSSMVSPRGGWFDAYGELISRQPRYVSSAGPIVAGFSATTDAIHVVDDHGLAALLSSSPNSSHSPAFAAGLAQAREWITSGRDGEIFVDDTTADARLDELVGAPSRVQCGGTSIQAAWSWAEMGLHPLLSLQNRSERQLTATAGGISLAEPGGATVLVRNAGVRPYAAVPSNHVLEFPAGLRAGGVTVARASRIMMIFAKKRLQLDVSFASASPQFVAGGVGLVSGFNGLGEDAGEQIAAVTETVREWKDAGARLVHLELADYSSRTELVEVLNLCAAPVDSIGMNASEFAQLIGGRGDLATEAGVFGDAHGFSRVVIHGDRWAMSVHHGDPKVESVALMAGCVAAANRAEVGAPRARWSLPEAAQFASEIPPQQVLASGRSVTVVASPFLEHPRSTIGLGDTFVSGDLLIQSTNS